MHPGPNRPAVSAHDGRTRLASFLVLGAVAAAWLAAQAGTPICGASAYVTGSYSPVDRTHNGVLMASQHAQDPTSATASASAWSPWGAGGGDANAAASMGVLKAHAYNQLVVGTGQQPDHHGRSAASAWFQDLLTPWSATYPGYSASLTLGFTIHK